MATNQVCDPLFYLNDIDHYCDSQVSYLGGVVGFFPPFETCMEPSNTMKACNFQIRVSER